MSIVLIVGACSTVTKFELPDGSQGATALSSLPGVLSPSATVATTYLCRVGTPCKQTGMAVLGGTPLVNEIIRAGGSILTAQALPGTSISMSNNSTSDAQGGEASATGGNATATANPTVNGPTTTITNTNSGAPPGGPI